MEGSYCVNFHYKEPDWQNSPRRLKKRMAAPNVHIPNKAEAKTLRKIMAETSLTEAEIRTHKKYRKQLSDAQKEGAKPLDFTQRRERKIRKLLKQITSSPRSPGYKLPKEHPVVKEEFRKRLIEERKKYPYDWI